MESRATHSGMQPEGPFTIAPSCAPRIPAQRAYIPKIDITPQATPERRELTVDDYTFLLDFLAETDQRHQMMSYGQSTAGHTPFANGFRMAMAKKFEDAFYSSMHLFNECLDQIGGLPSHYTDAEGKQHVGKIVSAVTYNQGVWTFRFQSDAYKDGLRVEQTTSETMHNFLSAFSPIDKDEPFSVSEPEDLS